jgi:hypothetical protein
MFSKFIGSKFVEKIWLSYYDSKSSPVLMVVVCLPIGREVDIAAIAISDPFGLSHIGSKVATKKFKVCLLFGSPNPSFFVANKMKPDLQGLVCRINQESVMILIIITGKLPQWCWLMLESEHSFAIMNGSILNLPLNQNSPLDLKNCL